MMSVAASDLQDAIPMYSNYGASRVHLAAPGSEILSTVPNGRYFVLSGARPRRLYPVLQDGCRTWLGERAAELRAKLRPCALVHIKELRQRQRLAQAPSQIPV